MPRSENSAWFELIDSSTGETLRFDEFSAPLHVSATRVETAELYRAANDVDVVEADHVVIHLDIAHRGLGTASCGPDVLEQYLIGAGKFEMSYRSSRGR